jgi:hypothetical protein
MILYQFGLIPTERITNHCACLHNCNTWHRQMAVSRPMIRVKYIYIYIYIYKINNMNQVEVKLSNVIQIHNKKIK